MLYADDLVLTAETRAEVLEKINRWKTAMENSGLRENFSKTKNLFSGD